MASWNDRSWPLRRWLCDQLVGDNAYTRNVAALPNAGGIYFDPRDVVRSEPTGGAWPRWSTQPPFKPFDQEAS